MLVQPAHQQGQPFTRTLTDGTSLGAILGVQYLAQGHSSIQTAGAGDETTNLLITG